MTERKLTFKLSRSLSGNHILVQNIGYAAHWHPSLLACESRLPKSLAWLSLLP